ncbi:DUF1365 domain-containing protein [Octadecabacter sp. CECT 8868]|uniref:DUF1365 domain-containing protein n=1 Tax=Octadecabacter algicola TaxID=2909342 RepID=UPI001F19D18D|nr:DUF1365 domain-containing protein [Octadecabacter algicola]MCF2905171.1 DUF1365 domain-containing protein [Octadecabacter algicola]
MTKKPELIAGVTTHGRRGAIKHGFRYGVDFVLIDPETAANGPSLFSRNRFNLASVHDRDHGGPLKAGRGVKWAREVLTAHGLSEADHQLQLLTQPRLFGNCFNPVSFWLAKRGGDLVAVIAEVSTPFGDRHSYLCHLPNFAPITSDSRITTPKSLHVSPFQEVKGNYEFSFDIQPDRIAIRILYRNGDEGVVATLAGSRAPLTNTNLIKTVLRRPIGAFRTIALIHWQAVRLKLKGARYRTRPTPPKTEVT